MHRFEIWAPAVKSLSVYANGTSHAMYGPDEEGWWRAEVDAEAGSDYGYVIDADEKVYPDPRSTWQPQGVHGFSRVYDHSAFLWTDGSFKAPELGTGLVYELHIGTFTVEGTLDSAIERLRYLADLGVTHLELMPVASFAGEFGWGYDGVALYSVHEPYGGPDALKRFVDAAHAIGLAVLLDVVYNHFGPAGNYTGKYGPYLTDSHKTPWGCAVNLERQWSHEVRRFFCDNALMWLRDYHLDGLRLDAVHALIDRSAIHFMEQLATEVNELETQSGRKLVLIAESDSNDPRTVTPREESGLGMDAQWSDDLHHALFTVVCREPESGYFSDFGTCGQLAKAIEHVFVYDGIYSRYRNRIHGKPAGELSRQRFLGYIQNHDQVGNRATGDRVAQVVGLDRAKVAAALVLTAPFVPMIFQGEEWAASSPFQYFADHEDLELAQLVSVGRKSEFEAFGWNPELIPDPVERATFERCKLDWDERTRAEHAEMGAWYRALIRLRRATPALNDGVAGQARVEFDEERKWMRMTRGPIAVVCNLGGTDHTFAMTRGSEIVLASREGTVIENGSLTVAPDGVAVVVVGITHD